MEGTRGESLTIANSLTGSTPFMKWLNYTEFHTNQYSATLTQNETFHFKPVTKASGCMMPQSEANRRFNIKAQGKMRAVYMY